jgi:hypothetical protein
VNPTPEAATLGSLLWNPGAVTGVWGWLAGSDFADPWHAEVYQALLTHTHTGTDTSGVPVGVGLVLRDRLGPRRADLPRLADLAGGTPTRPDPIAYARLVLEASLRRQIATYPLVLRAGALAAAAQRHPHPLNDALQHVRVWTEQARYRWQAAQNGGQAGFDPDTATTARTRLLLGADRFLATHPTPTTADRADTEGFLIGALLTHPGRLPAVASIHADDLADPLAADALAGIRSLARAGEHIDPVTVTAHMTRHTPESGEQVGARLGEWAHSGGVRDLDHLATSVLLNTAIAAASDADQHLAATAPTPIGGLLAEVGLRLDRLGCLANAVGPTLAPARSRLSLAPPAPRSAADDAFVLEVG